MAEANKVIAPRLGLPVLPVVEWPDADEEPQRGVRSPGSEMLGIAARWLWIIDGRCPTLLIRHGRTLSMWTANQIKECVIERSGLVRSRL